ncbi:phage portal protein [Hyphomonas sp.]|uniref:phage portal protein n=1 Tax=Hyphomonas sp. TaxID=87 RepID=UPI0032F04917
MITRLLSAFGFEKRDSSYPHNPAFYPGNWARGIGSYPYATPDAVLSNIAVAARCVSLRSELLASVALKLYRKTPNGDREQDTQSPLALALGDLANPLMTSFECREFMVRMLDLTGNAYARLVRDGGGMVREIWPVHSNMVTVERLESGRLRYRIAGHDNQPTMTLIQDEVLHVRASSEDGLLGRSPIEIARGVLGRTIAENATAATLAQSSFRPAGVVTVPNAKIEPKSRRVLEDTFSEDHSTPDRVGRVRVLEGGARFTPIMFTSVDAQFLESRILSNEDTARIFGVPGGAVGIRDSVSYGSAAADAQALVQNCLQPLAERVEQALMRCLLTPTGRRNYTIQHDLRGLVRGNMPERFAAYRIGREVGMYSVNDLRRMENEPPVDGGDTYMNPATLAGGTPNTDVTE